MAGRRGHGRSHAESRFTFGRKELLGGIDFIVVSIGLFAIAEVLINLESQSGTEIFKVPRVCESLAHSSGSERLSFCFLERLRRRVFHWGPARRRVHHCFVLVLRFGKGFLASTEKFGTGVIEGVAAPEGANNSQTGGGLVPLLTLGIPGSSTTAILLAALHLWGFRPGPLLIQENPNLFWGLVASMYMGNVMLLILNLPLVPLFAQILRVPYYVLYPGILGVSIIGVYTVDNSLFDVWMLGLFGLLGYFMRKLDYPSGPLVLGMVLGQRSRVGFAPITDDVTGTVVDPGGESPCRRDVTFRCHSAISADVKLGSLVESQGHRAGSMKTFKGGLDMERQQFHFTVALLLGWVFTIPVIVCALEIDEAGGRGGSKRPGGGSDLFARAIAEMLQKEKLVSQRLQVVNKSGGGSAVAMSTWKKRRATIT